MSTTSRDQRSFFMTSTLSLVALCFIFSLNPLLAQTSRDSVWIGYDKGKTSQGDSLITFEGQYIGMQYGHQVAGWGYAMKIDLREFGTKIATNDFWPIQIMFNVFSSSSPAGKENRNMTAYVWDDSSGFPGKVLSGIPFTMIHQTVIKDTIIILTIPSPAITLRKKNPLWFGFEEGPTTNNQLFTWMRSTYSPGVATHSYDRPPGTTWAPITQPDFRYPELRRSYNVFFRAKYVGDTPLDVDDPAQAMPSSITLDQNFPNPFSNTTTIRFEIRDLGRRLAVSRIEQEALTSNHRSFISLKVFDALGREVASLIHGALEEGEHVISFFAASLPSGIYHYVLSDGRNRISKSMVLIR